MASRSELTERDLRRAVASLQAVASENGDYRSFVYGLLDRLPELVPSDLTTLSLCDLEAGTRAVVGRKGETLTSEDRAAFDRHFREHPLVRYHAGHPRSSAQRISDCLSTIRFRDTPVFADYYRKIGISHAMALPLRIDRRILISVVFNRSGADFKDRERAVLDVLQQPLAALYRTLLAREEACAGLAALQGLVADNGWQVAHVGEDGRLKDLSDGALRLLRHVLAGASVRPGAMLPAELADWLRRSRPWRLDEDGLWPNSPLLISRAGRKLRVHRVADPAAVGCSYLLMRLERNTVSAEDLAELPLSPREREVVALVAAGKTNGAIALILGISPRTVQKHLEHAFGKLGVETRTGAAMRVMMATANTEAKGS